MKDGVLGTYEEDKEAWDELEESMCTLSAKNFFGIINEEEYSKLVEDYKKLGFKEI
jgi:hypothetical protein